MLCHLSHIGWTAQRGFKFTHLLHAFKSTQSDEWLYFSWGIRGTFFTQTHSNVEGYSQGFLPRGSAAVRTCSQGSSPFLIWQPYLSCLVKPIHLAYNCHKQATVVGLFIALIQSAGFCPASSACVQYSVNIASLLFRPRLFISSM